MKRVYFMENGRKVYYFGEFDEKRAKRIVRTDLNRKKGPRFSFIEDADMEGNQ